MEIRWTHIKRYTLSGFTAIGEWSFFEANFLLLHYLNCQQESRFRRKNILHHKLFMHVTTYRANDVSQQFRSIITRHSRKNSTKSVLFPFLFLLFLFPLVVANERWIMDHVVAVGVVVVVGIPDSACRDDRQRRYRKHDTKPKSRREERATMTGLTTRSNDSDETRASNAQLVSGLTLEFPWFSRRNEPRRDARCTLYAREYRYPHHRRSLDRNIASSRHHICQIRSDGRRADAEMNVETGYWSLAFCRFVRNLRQ